MANSGLFIVNILLLATLIAGASFLQYSRNSDGVETPSVTANTRAETITTSASAPSSTASDQPAPSPTVQNPLPTPHAPAPTLSPKPSIPGSSERGEGYDD